MQANVLRLKTDIAKLRPAEELYIACEEMDFSWMRDEVERTIELWSAGLPIDKIADKLGRPVQDTFILLYDLAERGKIDSRPGGVFGSAGCGVKQ